MILHLQNLAPETTKNDLYVLFHQFGIVTDINLVDSSKLGQPRGLAFVKMSNDAEMRDARLALAGKDLHGMPMDIAEAPEFGKDPKLVINQQIERAVF